MGYILVILCQIIMGSSYPIAGVAINTIPVWVFTTVTLGVASVIMLPLAKIVDKTCWTNFSLKNWYKVGAQSLLSSVLYTVFLLYGLQHSSPIIASVFTSISPAVVFVLAPFLARERLNILKGLSIILSIFAVLVMTVQFGGNQTSATDTLGMVFMFLSTLSVALFVIFSKNFSVDIPPVTQAAGVIVTGFVFCLPMGIYQGLSFDWSIFLQGANLWSTIYYALFIWAAAYVLWYYGIVKVPATFGGLAQAFVPIAAAFISITFYGQQLRTVDTIGLALVMISVIVSTFAEKNSARDIALQE